MVTAPFMLKRRIAWGDCDPARIYYTPRAVDCAVEAIEAWYEAVLGLSWVDLAERYALDAPFVQVDCDYRRPLVAGQIANLQVWVTEVGHSTVTFVVVGEDGDGILCFLARLVGGFVEQSNNASMPIPTQFRQSIENYQAQCGEVAAVVKKSNRLGLTSKWNASGPGTDKADCSCLPGSSFPFARQRRVMYGDCDASGVVYAPRVFNYAIETVEEWYEEIVGISWLELVSKREQGAPFVSVSCDYLRPMVPGQMITAVVWVTSLGGASLEFAVVGFDATETACFDARLVACFIDQNGFKTMRIPEVFRTRIQAYQSDCEAFMVVSRIPVRSV